VVLVNTEHLGLASMGVYTVVLVTGAYTVVLVNPEHLGLASMGVTSI